jgi:hypothetical protein
LWAIDLISKYIQIFILEMKMKYTKHLFFIAALISVQVSFAASLITVKEAALPAASGALATRGISRGPGVKLDSPEADTSVASPFDFKLSFEPRGDAKIDVNSVKVIYMKSPFVDLTPRLKNAISANGINLTKAEVPPGTHTIRVTVKDTDGIETNYVFTKVEAK